MKKTLATLATLFLSCPAMQSQTYFSSGYHGDLETGYSIGIGDYDFGRFEVNTSHGYQFNPYFFLGAGIGLHVMEEYSSGTPEVTMDYRNQQVDIPIYANLRCHLLNKRFSPLVDMKAGYFVTNNGGLYANISAGFRYALNSKMGLNFTVGYVHEELKFECFKDFISHSGLAYYTQPRKLHTEALSLKVGFDF